MPQSRTARALASIVVAAAIAGCQVVGLGTALPAGARQWIIPVENQGARPVVLVVAEDLAAMGDVVGTVNPAMVPPGATVDVTFGIPPGRAWAIFVNPGPDRGPLITAADVPMGVAGRLPLTITVGAGGEPSVTAPSFPGWFGN